MYSGISHFILHTRCLLFILFFFFKASDEEKYDLVREGVVIFTGALAKHLAKVLVSLFLSLCFSPFLVWEITVNLDFSFCFNICTSKQDDPKVHTVVEKLLDVVNTPSEAVQRAVSACLSPLMQSKQVCL